MEMLGVIDFVKKGSLQCGVGSTRDTFSWQVWMPESSTRWNLNFLYWRNRIRVLTGCFTETIVTKPSSEVRGPKRLVATARAREIWFSRVRWFCYRAPVHSEHCYIDMNISEVSLASILYVISCPATGLRTACSSAPPRYFMTLSKFRGKRSCVKQRIWIRTPIIITHHFSISVNTLQEQEGESDLKGFHIPF